MFCGAREGYIRPRYMTQLPYCSLKILFLDFVYRKRSSDGRGRSPNRPKLGGSRRLGHTEMCTPGASTVALQSGILAIRGQVVAICSGKSPALYQLYFRWRTA